MLKILNILDVKLIILKDINLFRYNVSKLYKLGCQKMKIKSIMLIGLSFSILNAGNVNTDFANGIIKSKSSNHVQVEEEPNISLEEITNYTKQYQKVLGINKVEYNKLIKRYYEEDPSWKKANYYLYKTKRKANFKKTDDIRAFEKNQLKEKVVKIPKWKKALENFKISCIEHSNPISAAQGLDILLINLSMFDNTGRISSKELNSFFNKYLLIFTRILESQEICYGYTGEVLYWADRKNDINKAKKVINEGWDICERQVKENGVPKYLFDTLRLKAGKINAILKVRKAKGER